MNYYDDTPRFDRRSTFSYLEFSFLDDTLDDTSELCISSVIRTIYSSILLSNLRRHLFPF